MIHAGTATGGDHRQAPRIGRDDAWHKGAALRFKMTEHTHFILKAFLGLRPVKLFGYLPVKAHAHSGPEGILHGDHGTGRKVGR